MNIGLQLALIAVALWLAIGIAGERAPQFLWAWLWIPIGLIGVLLQHIAYWANGREPPRFH